jgi:large subunit ribosomal protein L21
VYAVVRTGGKQYRVEEGQTITVDRLSAGPGENVDLEVLALADGDSLEVGTPVLSGARVTAEVLSERKGRKVDVLRYKSKVRYRKRTGFRPILTDLRVTKISAEKR